MDLCRQSNLCYLTISFSAACFSFPLQFFPAAGTFPVSQLFASGGQSTGASASASLPSKYSGLISFRIDLFDLLAVQGTLKGLLQGTLKGLLQHHNLRASILQCSAYFMVSYKTEVLTIQTFVGKATSLLFKYVV